MALFDRVLILGGGGMLAHALKEELAGVAGRVIAPARAELDVCDGPALAAALDRATPTLVINCAAHTKVDLCDYQVDLARAINGKAAGAAAVLAKHRGAGFVHYSTDFVFSGAGVGPSREDDPVGPLSEYGRSKLMGERAVLAAHPQALIIRTSWLYGPGGPSFPATILRVARAGRPLHVVADQRGSPTYTVDLARATVELLEAGATGVHHLSNAGETTWHEFAEHTLQAFGLSAPVGKLSAAEWATKTPSSAARPARSTMDLSKAEAALGRKMRPWREALQDFARHPLAGK